MRVGDVAFLTSQLSNTTFTSPLLAQFPGTFDPTKVVVYGHSFGGATAATAAQRIPAVIGGLNFDGTLYGPVNEQGFKGKPFVLVASTRNYTRQAGTYPPVPDWSDFYAKVDGAKMELAVWDTQHYAFMDVPLLLSAFHTPPESQPMIEQTFGTLSGRRVEAAQNEIVTGLLELAFDGDEEPLRCVGRENFDVYVALDGLSGREWGRGRKGGS
jgi:pimeloyl-ACP methyl ester carboxylesterase